LLQEFFFGDDATAMLEKVEEHIQHLGLDGHCLADTVQLTAFRIEFIVTEAIDHTLLL
jgi:hypothetical protein